MAHSSNERGKFFECLRARKEGAGFKHCAKAGGLLGPQVGAQVQYSDTGREEESDGFLPDGLFKGGWIHEAERELGPIESVVAPRLNFA